MILKDKNKNLMMSCNRPEEFKEIHPNKTDKAKNNISNTTVFLTTTFYLYTQIGFSIMPKRD
jgi:hypothetical protein